MCGFRARGQVKVVIVKFLSSPLIINTEKQIPKTIIQCNGHLILKGIGSARLNYRRITSSLSFAANSVGCKCHYTIALHYANESKVVQQFASGYTIISTTNGFTSSRCDRQSRTIFYYSFALTCHLILKWFN